MDLSSLAGQIKQRQISIREKAMNMSDLVRSVKKIPLDISVCAVDGGLLAHRMHGADIVVVRAAGVCFTYENSKLKSCEHFPGRSPEPSVELRSTLDEHEANIFRSLVRLKHELGCANAVLEKYSPQLLLLDGSLLPIPSDIPPKESELRPLYEEVLELYEKLYSKECIFCGIAKDSRARRLSKDCSDSVLCNFLLDESERTKEMDYGSGRLAGRIRFFYIKPSKDDIPLRIEVIGDVEKAAETILSLSSISQHFAYPAILIEADMCAALDPVELTAIENSLHSIAGIKPLRRNSRPFR